MIKLKFEKISDDFFVADLKREWNEEKNVHELRLIGWQKVKGKEVEFPGFEDYTFFYYKEGERWKSWRIAEATTGRNINSYFEGFTLKQAKEDTLEILIENKPDMDVRLEELIEKFGISPRYKLITKEAL